MLMGHDRKFEKPINRWEQTNIKETHQVAETEQGKTVKLRKASGIPKCVLLFYGIGIHTVKRLIDKICFATRF